MFSVGLTGGIACGKSVVAAVFAAKRGCFVRSADRTARNVMRRGNPAWKHLVERFGSSIQLADGSIDRTALGRIIFHNARERAWVESLIHPRVLARMKARMERLHKEGRYRIYVSESALLFEAGLSDFFDRIVVVFCPEADQIRRLMRRDGIGRREALARIRIQLPQKDKIRRADYLIDASGTLEDTVDRSERLFARLLSEADMREAFLGGKDLSPTVRNGFSKPPREGGS